MAPLSDVSVLVALVAMALLLQTAAAKERFHWSHVRRCLRCGRPETGCVCRRQRRLFLL